MESAKIIAKDSIFRKTDSGGAFQEKVENLKNVLFAMVPGRV
jgi:hypothetical protein